MRLNGSSSSGSQEIQVGNSSEKDAMDGEKSPWKTQACVLFSPRCGLGENVQRDIKTWIHGELEDAMETI